MVVIALTVLILTALSAMARKPSRWDNAAAARKADYVFMEAVNAQLRGDDASYFQLLRHAHELNPQDEETANAYAPYLVHLQSDDSVAVSRGSEMMKRYFDRHPDDLYSALTYALLAQRLGNYDEALRAFRTVHFRHPERSGVTHRYAQFLAGSGRAGAIDSALAVYDSLMVTEGPSIELVTSKIQVLAMRRDTAAIMNEARRFYTRAPLSVDNNVFLAEVFASFEQNDSALTYYNRACEIDSTNASALYFRAGFYHNIGDSAAFDREIFKVLKMDDLEVPTKLGVMRDYIAELYGDSLQTPRILDLFNALTEMHPHESEIHTFYSAYLFMINRFSEAADQQEIALDLAPDSRDKWLTLIRLRVTAEEEDKGIEAATRALKYFPDDAELHLMRGSILGEKKRSKEALADLRQAIELTDSGDVKQLSDLYCWMGDIYFMESETETDSKALRDSSFTCYRKATELNPLNAIALNNLAYHLAVEGRDLDQALDLIKKAVMIDEPSVTTIDTYAWVLFKRGEYEAARAKIDEAIELEPELSADVADHAGDIYFHLGDTAKALDFWQKALELDPSNDLLKKKVKHKTYFPE